jgi:hypothetical protein
MLNIYHPDGQNCYVIRRLLLLLLNNLVRVNIYHPNEPLGALPLVGGGAMGQYTMFLKAF